MRLSRAPAPVATPTWRQRSTTPATKVTAIAAPASFRSRASSSASPSRPASPAARAAGRATRTSEAKMPTSETAPAAWSQRTAMAASSIRGISGPGGRDRARPSRRRRSSSRGPRLSALGGSGSVARLRTVGGEEGPGCQADGRHGPGDQEPRRPVDPGLGRQHRRAVIGRHQARRKREKRHHRPSDRKAPGGAERDSRGRHRVYERGPARARARAARVAPGAIFARVFGRRRKA